MPAKFKVLPLAAVASALIAITVITAQSCRQTPDNQVLDGRATATKYCTSCHELPEPVLADKKSWEQGILPAMAKNLGLKVYMGQVVLNRQSAVSAAEWQTIAQWYISHAPDSLIIQKPAVAAARDLAGFEVLRPKNVQQQIPAMTTMIAVNPLDKKLYTADAMNNLYTWSPELKSKTVYTFDSPITGVDFVKRGDKNTGVFTAIGNMLPVDISKGKIYEMGLDPVTKPVQITDSLPRPVQTVTEDFNKDGIPDYVVCGFGHDRGGVFYVAGQPGGKFKKQLMLGLAGGTQLIKGDFNNDGWMDVMCLFGQADESIWLFTNNKKGGFDNKRIMRFPPIYGSSSFQLVDFNKDGKLDILYTAGDNSDYSKVLKPYHGVYIFTNQGDWKFKQTFFYQINGAGKALAADFDGDGDLDIAAIAFFADFKYHPEEGFTYLEQTGANTFKPYHPPVEQYGRWISMDVNDVDGDGLPDIILGNFSIGQRGLLNQKGVKPEWDQFEPIIVLKNKHQKK